MKIVVVKGVATFYNYLQMKQTFKPDVKTEFLKFRTTKQQKKWYRIASNGNMSGWALPILDRAAKGGDK